MAGMLVEKNTIEWLIRLARTLESSKLLSPGHIEKLIMKVAPRFQSDGDSIKYFVLAEDAAAMPVNAYPAELDEATGSIAAVADSDPFELYYWLDVLNSPAMATAGYAGIYSRDSGGRDVFVNGPCIEGCTTTASIDPDSPPDGEDGTAYTHTVIVSGLDVDGVTADNLPPGLSLNPTTGAITGTPTTPGTYWVTFMGDSDDDPSCPLTRIAKIVIWGEGLNPNPPVEEP